MSNLLRGLALGAFLVLPSVAAAQDAETVFHRAYFLERERGDLEEALQLYRSVATDAHASDALRDQAEKRATDVTEDLAAGDLARLMPRDALLYAELARPGAALERFLTGLGLVGSLQDAAARGGFVLRPELIRALTGLRGAAVALTRLPGPDGQPGGVLVLHPGELEVLGAALQAGVLAEGTPEDPIEGAQVWSIGGRVSVALTARLIVASDERAQIAGVLRRLHGTEKTSLADEPRMAERAGATFFCCVNAVPMRGTLQALLDAQTRGNPGMAVAATALDVGSLQALVARASLGDDGLELGLELFLEEGQRNLVFNLLRGAPLDPAVLARLPEGAAFFAAGALNPRGPALAPLEHNPAGAPVVTALDFARELFANVAGYALYVLPGGAPVPAAALVLSSNDPARTAAVVGLVLGLANSFTGQPLDGAELAISGAPARVYHVPPGFPIYVATRENTLIVSPSRDAVEQALEGAENETSVLHDEAFAAELAGLGKDATFALCVHLGRTLEVARPFLGGDQGAELARFAPLLERTVVSLSGHHSATRLAFQLALRGLPHVDGLVAEALQQRRAALASAHGHDTQVVQGSVHH